jgi:hypothetical protein
MWEFVVDLNATQIAAWYAAFISSLGLGWEIYKYVQKGIELSVTAKGNMIPAGDPVPVDKTDRVVSVNVRHVKGPPTTITHVGIAIFRSRWHKLITYDSPGWFQSFLKKMFPSYGYGLGVAISDEMCDFPDNLKVGEEWDCYIDQNEIPELDQGEEVYVSLTHTLADREIMEKIRL